MQHSNKIYHKKFNDQAGSDNSPVIHHSDPGDSEKKPTEQT